MATVPLEFKAFLDGRYKVLAKLIGQTRFDARGRCEEVYKHCIEENTYTVSGILIDAISEIDGFAEAMVQANLASKFEKLDDDTDGAPLPEGVYRIKGTQGRIEYLEEARIRQKHATEVARQKRLEQKKKAEDPAQGSLFENGAASPPNLGDLEPQSPTSDPTLEPTSEPSLVSSSASSSVSVSSSVSKAGKKTKTGKPTRSRAPKDPEVGRRAQLIIAAYVKAYKANYQGAVPVVEGPNAGAALRLAGFKSFSDDDLRLVVKKYVEMQDAWFLTKDHDLPTLIASLNKVSKKIQTGKSFTRAEINSIERKQTTINAFGPLIAEAEARESQERGQ